MTIPPRFLDEIRARVTLSEVIGKRVRLTRAGREFKGCCPFHKEKSPSFTVNDDKQFYHCFGCGAHGDVIGFVMQHGNLTFMEAVESLAAQAGMQVPKSNPADIARAEKSRDLHKLMDLAASWMQEQLRLPKNRDVLDYVRGRGISDDTLSSFRIGYAPEGRQELRAYLKGQGYTDEHLIEAGITKKSEKGAEPYVFFRERLMFPVTDRRGRIVAFGGRTLPDHMRAPSRDGYTPAKYINSSDTPLFDKGRMLYGEAAARLNVKPDCPALVVEGYMDVIACHQAGFKGAVAPMGTALTEEQILGLWKMIPGEEKIPILCFDGDNAGQQAAMRASARILPLLGPGQSARFAFMPQGEDPDSLLRAGKRAAFEEVLKSSMTLFDYLWFTHTAGRDVAMPEIRAGITASLNQAVAAIHDAEVQRHYKELIRTKIAEAFFARPQQPSSRPFQQNRQRGGFGGRQSFAAGPVPSGIKPRAPSFQDKAARIFLAAILNHPAIFDSFEEDMAHFPMPSPGLDRLRQDIMEGLISGGLDRDGLHHHLNNLGHKQFLNDIVCESIYIHAAFTRPMRDSQEAGDGLRAWLGERHARDWTEIQEGWSRAFALGSEKDEKIVADKIAVIKAKG